MNLDLHAEIIVDLRINEMLRTEPYCPHADAVRRLTEPHRRS